MKLYRIIREILDEAWDTSISKDYLRLFNNKKEIPAELVSKYKPEVKDFKEQVSSLKKSRTHQFLNSVFSRLELSPIKTLKMEVVSKPNYVSEVKFDAEHENNAKSTGYITFDGQNIVFYATKIIYNDGSEKIVMDPNTPDEKLYKKKHTPKEKEEKPKDEKPEKNTWEVPDAKKKPTVNKEKEKKEKEKEKRKEIRNKKADAKKEKEELPAEYQQYKKGQGSWMLRGANLAKVEDTPENLVKLFIKDAAKLIGYEMKKEPILNGKGRNWNVKYGELSADVVLSPLGKFDIRNVVVKFNDYVIFKYKAPE